MSFLKIVSKSIQWCNFKYKRFYINEVQSIFPVWQISLNQMTLQYILNYISSTARINKRKFYEMYKFAMLYAFYTTESSGHSSLWIFTSEGRESENYTSIFHKIHLIFGKWIKLMLLFSNKLKMSEILKGNGLKCLSRIHMT